MGKLKKMAPIICFILIVFAASKEHANIAIILSILSFIAIVISVLFLPHN